MESGETGPNKPIPDFAARHPGCACCAADCRLTATPSPARKRLFRRGFPRRRMTARRPAATFVAAFAAEPARRFRSINCFH